MVPLTFLRKKATRSVPLLLAALIFAGCGTQAPDQSTAHLQGSAQADSGFYLQQMSQSSNDTKTNWQLLAIRALLKEGKSQQAIELLNQLPPFLTGDNAIVAQKVCADVGINAEHYLLGSDIDGMSDAERMRGDAEAYPN